MKTVESLARLFLELHPEEAARALETLDGLEAARVLAKIPVKTVASVVERLGSHSAGQLLEHFARERRREVLAALTPRQAASILQNIEPHVREEVLGDLPPRLGALLQEVVRYPFDTAGAMMEPRVASLSVDLSVQQAITSLRKAPREALYYLYVTDREGRLVGVVNMRDLLLASPGDSIERLVRRPVQSVPATTNREEVVGLMRESGFLALPVVDSDGKLIGVVKHDEALQEGLEQGFEDLQRMVGAGSDERAHSPVATVVRRRLPWLYVNLLTAFAAAAVVGLFEGVIEQVTALAVLLPVVSGQGGNSGSQALAIVMRGLALREIFPGTARRVVLKEVVAGVINGVAVAAVTAGAVFVWSDSVGLALVIGLSMSVNMVAAPLAGSLIPLVLRSLGQDPAQSASIILTTITDVVGFASFLGFAALFMWMLI